MQIKRLKWLIPLAFAGLMACPMAARAEGGQWTEEEGQYYYMKDDGSFQTGWMEKNGKWYYFDPETAVMQTGWLQQGKRWYYLSPATGRMRTGWLEYEGNWYYFDAGTGAMRTGWLQQGKRWYYLSPATGRLRTGWLEYKGRWYYFDPVTGAMKTGWLEYKGDWYYFNGATGTMRTGWLEYRGNWYFFDGTTGIMQTGELAKGGKKYYLRSGGEMAVGWETLDGKKYYFKESGEMTVGEILTIDGKRQGFSGEGDWLGEKTGAFLDAYGKALNFVKENTDSSMTKEEKLRKCFNLFRDTFHEKNPWIPHYTGMDWAEKYAYACLDTKSGNCFSYGAGFAFVARAIGYDDVYACSSGGHGWAEIGGLVYDPEWTKHAEGNYFGRPLKSGDSPNYLGAVTRTGNHWTYRKI